MTSPMPARWKRPAHRQLQFGGSAISNSGNIQVDGTLAVDSTTGTLTLNGNGTVKLAGGTISSPAIGQTLKNNGNTISGFGQIGDGTTSNLTLINAAGTIMALGGLLKLVTGNAVTNGGTLEANGATLELATKVLDTGVIEAVNGGTLDLKGGSSGQMTWNSSTAGVAGVNGIVLAGATDTMLVDASGGTLTLNGLSSGAVSINGGEIKGNGVTNETLDNVNSTISGWGTIGLGSDKLALINETGGVIDADVSGAGKSISFDTGSHAIVNEGLIEATDGGTLAFTDATITNSGTIEIDSTLGASSLIIHGGSLTLQGGNAQTDTGLVTLVNGSIVSDLSAESLVNVNNTISGSGAIGDSFLTLQNDQNGVIDANAGTLTINTGSNTVTNLGVMEATNGGTLAIDSHLAIPIRCRRAAAPLL